MQIQINGNRAELNLSKEEAIALVQKIIAVLPENTAEHQYYVGRMGTIITKDGVDMAGVCIVNVMD